ncbi:hypothetical protein DICPUDRAFT_154359 [Dictyostelium purpureum]|uniref:Aromatic amino acid beta-eliminating lyase/threonine aldolase domain-containing protein n=1 Tax=Dictyostelium purpureum TaxID=5786 RepID=F0ZR54_DICPU|nr:uncharacterized protein DICPUDRAFT_154359 [Dictyostelium purpureum]EGC33587.1 hypothetical protein DICPUDRAFT_154359 [Dictyostelium purpureum]|eukprot:XP_003289902.1 hypothetical protein DICPUDRAFT_154359 [Dictyostelium purpureum]
MVEEIKRSTRKEREEWIKDANYNLFKLASDQVYIDLLTDSGTGSMSANQYAEMMTGDESYAGSKSYFKLKETIKELFNFDFMLPTHQGRAAENVLFSVLVKEGDIVPGNSHFDTTKGHIEIRKARAIDCTVMEAFDTQIELPFKGNICLEKLEEVLKEHQDRVPFVLITITNNLVGGQPVSLENIMRVRELATKYNKPVLMDSARFAENAYFIKIREKKYNVHSIKEIVREMFSFVDGMLMSGKKDGICNIGGFMAMHSEEWYEKASVFNIIYEGFITYGGLSGRDMGALAIGLREATEFSYLETRIKQVEYLAKKLDRYNIQYQRPSGGHAIFIDAKKILTSVKKEEFIAQTLAIELYLECGIRGVEIGTLLADRDPITRENRYPKLELLRLAIPRRTYTNNHMKVVAKALRNVYKRRHQITKGYIIKYEPSLLRHFSVDLAPIGAITKEIPAIKNEIEVHRED